MSKRPLILVALLVASTGFIGCQKGPAPAATPETPADMTAPRPESAPPMEQTESEETDEAQ
ncbi:MAG: hypothetical protein HYV02_00905 [Deltaproteobacteria bacterium]|nr:hypothetical protein [Deltaproteobacteria bacterium]